MLILLFLLFTSSAPAETKAEATFEEYAKLFGLDRGDYIEPEVAYAELKKAKPALHQALREHLLEYARSDDATQRLHAWGIAAAAHAELPLPAAVVKELLDGARKASHDETRDAKERALAWNFRTATKEKVAAKELEPLLLDPKADSALRAQVMKALLFASPANTDELLGAALDKDLFAALEVLEKRAGYIEDPGVTPSRAARKVLDARRDRLAEEFVKADIDHEWKRKLERYLDAGGRREPEKAYALVDKSLRALALPEELETTVRALIDVSSAGLDDQDAVKLIDAWRQRLLAPKSGVTPDKAILAYEKVRTNVSKRIAKAMERAAIARKRAEYQAAGLDRKKPCETLCQLSASEKLWLNEKFFKPEAKSGADTWRFAVESLGTFSLARAARFCPKARERLSTIIDAPGSEISLANLRKVSAAPVPGAPVDPPSVYGKMFFSGLLDDIAHLRPDAVSPDVRDKLDADLTKDVASAEKFQRYGGGSLFNNYLLNTAVSFLPTETSESYRRLMQVYRDTQRASEFAEKDERCLVPYTLGQKSARADDAAGRGVTFYLALLRREKEPSRKAEWAEQLGVCLEEYEATLPILVDHIGREGTHANLVDTSIRTGRAPYYGLPVLPYAFAAIQELKKAAPKQNEKWDRLRKDLTTTAHSAIDEKGLAKASGPTTFPSSPIYNNALLVWSLATSCALERDDGEYLALRPLGPRAPAGSWHTRPATRTH